MESSRKAPPMTKDETMLLVDLVAGNNIVNNKATNAANNKLKEQAWQTLANHFNSSITSFPRTPSQLRLKWENLKKSARKRCADMRNKLNKTGGGRDCFPPDEILDKVASLLGSTCQGFSVEFGGDAIPSASLEKDSNLVMMGENINVEGVEIINGDRNGDGDSGGSVGEEVLKEVQILETPPPIKKSFFFNKASGSGTLAKRKYKMEEEKCKASILRDNAFTEYLTAKKKEWTWKMQKRRTL
ncbi:uncharacterized protein LOC105841327 [Bombyx mori]|uniref:Regulatory protein zeste n=1 Tax=Bombyx mori TaxID=7091 RepID=A0A8R2G763_BOMMO|nr:uncharacterized protein LOC105841327 [Bombyx mori]